MISVVSCDRLRRPAAVEYDIVLHSTYHGISISTSVRTSVGMLDGLSANATANTACICA